MGFNDQECGIWAVGRKFEAEGGTARDHDVVSLVIREQPKVSFQNTMPTVNEVYQVSVSIAIEIIHRLFRLCYPDDHILIEHQCLTSQHSITYTCKPRSLEVMMTLYAFVPWFMHSVQTCICICLFYPFHPRRRLVVIEN